MLERIETFYLACLRVLVLVAATVALIIFVWACSQAVPGLSARFGVSAPAKTPSPALSEFIQEQKAVPASQPADSSLQTSSGAGSPKIKQAASLLIQYMNRSGMNPSGDRDDLAEILENKSEDISDSDKARYEDSLLALMRELNQSKGAPLTVEKIDELLNWHISKFQQASAEQAAEEIAADAKANISLIVGAVALGSFLMIIFFFIFVKIERNLRALDRLRIAAVEQSK